jgi:prepilin-type processing-associated H-X9-DG protein
MRRIISVSVVAIVLLMCGGLLPMSVARVREAAKRQQCKNNLHMLAIELNNYETANNRFPRGTVANESLPPDKRLSWYVETWPYTGDGQIGLLLDRTKPWDSEQNLPPKGGDQDPPFVLDFRNYRCPANPELENAQVTCRTHYVGISGVGNTAANRPADYPQNGLFGYDRSTRLSEITRGTSTVMMLIEINRDVGYWTAGGPATIRGLDPGGPPYLGVNGQFSSMHRYPAGWILPSPHATNVAFADGSVRSFTKSLDPGIFEAMATIAGHDVIERLGDD